MEEKGRIVGVKPLEVEGAGRRNRVVGADGDGSFGRRSVRRRRRVDAEGAGGIVSLVACEPPTGCSQGLFACES